MELSAEGRYRREAPHTKGFTMRMVLAAMAFSSTVALQAQAPTGAVDALKPKGRSVRLRFARDARAAMAIVVAAERTAAETAAADVLKTV
ncbi:MAG: hypothetical protein QGI33_04040, partial [Candidatus Brocadiia bacterium]|nr:hypothetical protein [Candidatus Brocadiia bacterium]